MGNRHVIMTLKEVADIKFCIVNSNKEGQNPERIKWITASNLLSDNIINEVTISEKYFKDNSLLLCNGDIIIKRIQPSFVNYINKDISDTYAYNNLIIVRTTNINSKYLAAVLYYKIKEISLNSSIGAVMASIGRKELDNFEIPMLSAKEQQCIGEIWYKSIEKKKMVMRLAELENIKENHLINKYINNQIGGKRNDNI